MFLIRLFQLCGASVIVASNGWLMNLIKRRSLGLGPNMVALEYISLIVVAYLVITIFVLHILHKSNRRRYIVTFIVWDLLFTGVCIAMISVYSFAGVPNNCGGMTRSNWGPGDAPNDPAPGFTTIRFGPGTFGNYGELDIYCDIPITDYSFCVILVFTYMISIVLAILRIFSYRYTRNTLVTSLVMEAEEKGKRTPSISIHSDLTPLRPTRSSVSSISVSPVASSRSQDIIETDPVISNGSRGSSARSIRVDPPPYMPDLEAGRMEGHADESNATRLSGYIKNQSFPGLEGGPP